MTAVEALEAVLGWFDAHAPGGRARLRLRPPADAGAIAALERRIGLTLPEDVKALWRVHDGQALESEAELFPSRWLSVEECAQQWSQNVGFLVPEWTEPAEDPRLVDCVFHLGRVPLAGDVSETIVYLDLAPGPAGAVGQLIMNVTECDFVVLGNSVTDVLARYARLAAAGAITFLEESYPGASPVPLAYDAWLWDVLTLPPPPSAPSDTPLGRALALERYGAREERPVRQWLALAFDKLVAPAALFDGLGALPLDALFAILVDAHARVEEVPVPDAALTGRLLERLDGSRVDEALRLLDDPATPGRAVLGSFLLSYVARWSDVRFADTWVPFAAQLRARAPDRPLAPEILARFSEAARVRLAQT